MNAFGLWLRRGFGLLALGFGAAGLFGLGKTLVDAIRGGASLLMLLPMVGIAMVFIVPMLVVGRRLLVSVAPEPSPEPAAAGRAGWWGGLLVLALGAGLVVGAGYWFKSANRDLIELSRAREVDLPAIRPALLKFRAERGRYPAHLADLVPGYLPRLPESLINREDMEPVLRLGYRADGETAQARYHRHRGPDSSAEYDFVTGRLHHDQ
jgi:hypothetical protein